MCSSIYQYHEQVEGLTDCIFDSIRFCADITVSSTEIKCFPSNKPWVTSRLKSLLNQKKKAFRKVDRERVKALYKELRVQMEEGKQSYRQKMEHQLR